MKISFVFKFNSINSSSADTDLATCLAVERRFKRNRDAKYLDSTGENDKRKRKFGRKRKRCKLSTE